MKTLKTTPLALMLALALAAPALAQETTEAPADGAPATDAGVAADAGTTEGLSMGAEVGAAPGVGDTYTAATFEAWEQRCIKTESGADPCQLYQLLKDEKGNAVAEFSVF